MKIVLGATVALLAACGSERGPNVRLIIEGPSDDSCIGVAGFEVTVSPTGQSPQTRELVDTAPVLATQDCKLPNSFHLEGLAIDKPITVTVTGYDATGTSARVAGRSEISNLQDGDLRLRLERTAPTLPTLLVFHRNRFLENVPWDAIESMSIATQMGSKTLLNVDCKQAKRFFEPEPGAFGIPTGLVPGGADIDTALIVQFFAPDYPVKDGRITIRAWVDGHYVAN
jgi:hypothetical protein